MSFEAPRLPPVSGNVRRVMRRRGAVWYVKYRMPDPTRPGRVRQVERMLGPEWPDKGPPPPGYYDRRSAQAALEAILTDARRGAIELARTGVTFEQAAIEWLRWGEHERGWKRSTLVDRRSVLTRHLLPEFGALPVNQITTRRVEAWKIRWLAEHDARRQGAKLLAILHGIMERARRAYDLPRDPVADVDRIRISYDAARFDFYSPEEVYALARAAVSEQDAAMFLQPPSQGSAAASSSRCAGATSISRSARSASRAPSPTARSRRPRAVARAPSLWSPRWQKRSHDSGNGATRPAETSGLPRAGRGERAVVLWAGGVGDTWSARVVFEGSVDAEVRVRAKRRGRLD